MDLALRGEGFFAFLNQKGDSVYTRDGQFYVDSQGRMVNSMGHQFSDDGGASIQTIPGGGDVTIDKEGQVFQGNQNIGKVEFLHLKTLVRFTKSWRWICCKRSRI